MDLQVKNVWSGYIQRLPETDKDLKPGPAKYVKVEIPNSLNLSYTFPSMFMP